MASRMSRAAAFGLFAAFAARCGAHQGPERRLFASEEHLWLGDGLRLPSALAQGRNTSDVPLLRIPTGNSSFLDLSFGEIVFLAGDYYAVPSRPICFAGNETEARQRFLAAFETLFSVDANETSGLVDYVMGNREKLRLAMQGGQAEHAFYDSLGPKINEDLNRLTGGGSAVSPYVPMGRFLRIAANNFDHFESGNCSLKAYSVGHRLAVEEAGAPGAGLEQKTRAYAYEAFAHHFLSDSFSAGHIRMPRVEMRQHIDVAYVGDLLASYMHDEDSRLGLNVTNLRGDQWVSFGDECLFDSGSQRNAQLVAEAMQLAIDGVEGDKPWAALDVVPHPDPRRPSITPMFSWSGGALQRRKSLNEPWSSEVISSWTGADTLAELVATYKKPVDMPTQEPPQSAAWLFA